MRCVVQRVSRAEVRAQVGGEERRAAIGPGLLVLAGFHAGDSEGDCDWAAAKLAGLRVFPDAEGKMNLALAEAGGAILLVSQFTLAGSIARGRRPSFDGAMAPAPARALFDRLAARLRAEGVPVETGFFREHMAVELVNDGPVTFVLARGGEPGPGPVAP
ncbi:MAG TPA: D-aminoacyl-tRNA deacylase [Holophagaceae bacterium]|nr:D-aminoacyl-tRNA deacylase [Holophagaceae bacterium]